MKREISILNHLKNSVIQQFGKQITTATDCDCLAALLTQKFTANISSQTLRRFFGLIKAESKASYFTLDLLSEYCGYRDFKDFSHSYRNTELEEFFGDHENNGKEYWRKSEELCQQIIASPALLVNTHHRLMAFPMARKYFIESHPLRDLIGTVYCQYFLAYLKFNQSNEAKIFAYGFLFKSAFLLENTELMELYYNKVKETELSDEVHVIPAGLKYGIQLVYADFTGNSSLFKKYFIEMKQVRLQYIGASEKSVCSFESTVLESLIFTNRTKEMKFLIDNNTFQKESEQGYIPAQRKKTHDEVWNILCAASYQKLGDEKNKEWYLSRVNLENLGIGWKKYYSMIYYFIRLPNDDENKINLISNIENLIEETYFSYYDTLLKDYLNISESNREDFG